MTIWLKANVSADLEVLVANLLSLDQASRTTGWAVFIDDRLDAFGKIELDDADIGDRLVKLRKKVIELIEYYQIDEIAFEDIYMDGQRVNNVATFKILAEVFGVISELATELQIPNQAVLAGTWKSTLKIKGKTRPEQKRNAQQWVIDNYCMSPTQDECDAICIGAHILKKQDNEFNWE